MERLAASVDLVSRDHIDDATAVDEVMPVRERRDEAEVLLDEDHREAALPQLPHDAAEGLHDDGRQPLRELVEEEEARADAEDARHREHLLLAAGEARAA